MKVLSEYSLQIARAQRLSLPPHAQFVGVGADPQSPEEPLLWILHDQRGEDTPMIDYGIVMCQAGAKFDDQIELNLIGQFTIRGGTQVIHVFWTMTPIGEDV